MNITISEGTFEIDNDLRITNLSTIYQNKSRRLIEFATRNTLDYSLGNVSEQINTGETIVSLSNNHSLNSNEEIFVIIDYDYNTSGEKTLTATAISGAFIIKIFGGF